MNMLKKRIKKTNSIPVATDIFHPKNAIQWANKGFIFLRNDLKYAEALKCFEKALEYPDYENHEFYISSGMAESLYRLQEFDRSIEWLDKSIEITKNNKEYPTALFLKGYALYQMGRSKDALDYINESISIEPSKQAIRGKEEILKDMIYLS